MIFSIHKILNVEVKSSPLPLRRRGTVESPNQRNILMNFGTIMLCSVLLLVAPLFGREKSDIIIMKNDDHLTCEIKGLNAGVLYVSLDYILGTSSVLVGRFRFWGCNRRLENPQRYEPTSGNVHQQRTRTTGGRTATV